VVGVPDERLAEVPVAFVVAREGAAPAPADLLAFCRERIAAYKVPARVHVVPELPATDTGKLARRRLVELDRIAEGSAAA
jgi:acyl-CoA synthetase (AMP-forming)/AMP-acid ligase II